MTVTPSAQRYGVLTVAGSASSTWTDGVGSAASFSSPAGVCVNNVGSAPTTLFVADSGNHVIRAIDLGTRSTSTLVGAGGVPGWADGVGSAARFNTPRMCAVDSGNVYVYVTDEANGAIRRIALASRAVVTLIGKSCTSSGACTSLSANSGCCWQGLGTCTDAGCYVPGSGAAASLYAAQSLVLSYAYPCASAAGCLWVTSQLGTLSVVDLSVSPASMAMAACIGDSCTGCTVSGGCAAYSSQQLQGVAMDGASPPNVLVAIRSTHTLVQCQPGGSLSVLAACSASIVGSGADYQYVSSTSGDGNTADVGHVGSWADESVGAPLTASLIAPWGIAFDATAAALFVADQNVVRYVDFVSSTPDNVVTVAGGVAKGLPGVASVNAPNHWLAPMPANLNLPSTGSINAIGTNAAFNAPSNVVAAPLNRTLYIADTSNNVIRRCARRNESGRGVHEGSSMSLPPPPPPPPLVSFRSMLY